MAKAGLHALARHLAMVLADHAFRINAVSSAGVETSIYETFIEPEKIMNHCSNSTVPILQAAQETLAMLPA